MVIEVVNTAMIGILKESIAFILLNIPLFFRKNKKEKFLSIYFHNPPKKLFLKILRWLLGEGYTIISIKEFEKLLNEDNPDQKFAVLTFDDGWNKNLELIEIVNHYKIPIAVFISTEAVKQGNFWWEFASLPGQEQYTGVCDLSDFKNLPSTDLEQKIRILKAQFKLIRSALTVEELVEVSNNPLITIGSHTVSHPILINCNPERQEFELRESKRILEGWIKKEVEYFAYPNGDYNSETVNIVKNSGYRLGFTTKQQRLNFKRIDPLVIPRYCVHDTGGFYENLAKILGIWQIFVRR